MINYIMLGILAFWVIYSTIVKLTKKRKYDYNFIVAFVFLLGYLYLLLSKQTDTDYYMWITYIIPSVFVFLLVVDNLSLLSKKSLTDFDYYDLEQEFEHVKSSSELLRQRFISTIEVIDNGLAFKEDDYIFGTDKYVEIMGLKDNEISIENFEEKMHRDDLVQYKMIVEKLTKKYPIFDIKFRIKINDNYKWIHERGKLIIINKKKTYISSVKSLDIKLYPRTDIDVLDNLESSKKMFEEMQRLSRSKNAYHLVIIQLTNIPNINQKYGRELGDLMMGEYLTKLRFKFIKDSKSLYRITGIKFGLLIKEKSKYEILKRALTGTGELLTLNMKFGGISQTVYPNLGISESPYGGKNASQVLKEAEDALELTLKDNYTLSYAFHDE